MVAGTRPGLGQPLPVEVGGPGLSLFRAAEEALGPLPVIAEDLGVITEDVHELRDALGFPGMVVLRWSLSGPADNPHRLENHRVNQVV